MPPRRRAARRTPRKSPTRGSRRGRLARFWPSAPLRRRWWRAFRRSSGLTRLLVVAVGAAALFLCVNWIYQVIRKPTELFFPVSGTLFKTPTQTWRQYAPIFRKHSTEIISAELLAALAQVEGSGNPVARTYWRWSWKIRPFEIYRPATSAVGMYQITDGTFAEAKRFCVHHHVVVSDGPWDNWQSCWLNSLYFRVIPSHAVELTAAYLDVHVRAILERYGMQGTSLARKQDLAALIHLCGAGAGADYARRGMRLTEGQRCGDHEARAYVARVAVMKKEFAGLAAQDDADLQ